jgi:hypothetical protein
MKMRAIVAAIVVLGTWAIGPTNVWAQSYGTGLPTGHWDNPNGPTVSPYLNLLQSGNAGITNYQSLVKPLVEGRSAINQNSSGINNLRRDVNQMGAAMASGARGRGATGHASYFMEHMHYYNGTPAARAGMARRR